MKAVALFSGGLDSILAIRLIQSQGIEVIAVAFRSPFFISEQKMRKMRETAEHFGFKIKFIELGLDYIKLVRKPKHGHGKNMNPCIDCHTFMIKKAAAYAKKIGAKFVFTGEVLDERPMSQNRNALDIVEKEAGLQGKLLRPLSAKLLPMTDAEKKGYVDRNKLMAIHGRGRNPQFELAKQLGVKEFETPAGGCFLTDEIYSNKLRDLFKHQKTVSLDDVRLLKMGRHFRLGKNKIIVGRHKEDNLQLMKFSKKGILFDAKGVMGPITLLLGKADKKSIELAAGLTARYSDAKTDEVVIEYGKINKEIKVKKVENTEKYMVK